MAALVIAGLGGAAEAQERRAPGEPIPGITVKVGRKPPGGGTIVAEGTTDAQGVVRFAGLPPGQYFVRVALAGKSWEIPSGGAEQLIALAGAAPVVAPTAGSRAAAQPPVTEPKQFSRAVGDATATVVYGADWIEVGLKRAPQVVAMAAEPAAQRPAQPATRPFVPAQPDDAGSVPVGNVSDKELSLSDEHIGAMFAPLATDGFLLKDSRIVEHEGEIYLAADYYHGQTQEQQSIGVQLSREGENLSINRAATVVKCSIADNGYCKCEIPFCWCPADPGVDSPGRKCGKLVVEKKQLSDFFNGLNSFR
jgi:hypothetical protein